MLLKYLLKNNKHLVCAFSVICTWEEKRRHALPFHTKCITYGGNPSQKPSIRGTLYRVAGGSLEGGLGLAGGAGKLQEAGLSSGRQRCPSAMAAASTQKAPHEAGAEADADGWVERAKGVCPREEGRTLEGLPGLNMGHRTQVRRRQSPGLPLSPSTNASAVGWGGPSGV